MLWTLAITLLVFWAVGLATSTTMGGLIHLFLAVAIAAVVLRLLLDRRGRHHRTA